MTTPARVVVLNGGSSSGKTSLARALQHVLDDTYLHLDADVARLFLPLRVLVRAPDANDEGQDRFVRGFHRAAAGFADAGNNVIVDHMLTRRAWLDDCVEVLVRFRPLFVGVMCPVEVATRREEARGNRRPGLAETSAAQSHADALYDLEVDTSRAAPADLAALVVGRLDTGPPPEAFARLRARVAADPAR